MASKNIVNDEVEEEKLLTRVDKMDLNDENTPREPSIKAGNVASSDDSPRSRNFSVEDEEALKRIVAEVGQKPPKKKSSKLKKPKPSGFEEYFVDVPVTPDEFNEEQRLYHPSKAVSERLQIAIQRYSARRKFDSWRKNIFDKYMAYGRCKSGPNPFTGGVDEKDPNLTAADIAQMKAHHYFEEGVEESSYVDFDAVAKGFLSSYLSQVADIYLRKDVETAVGVVRNFLNYLLHHDVVPEYRHQVEAAKRTCDMAEGQLWLICQVSIMLPGKFNEACSVLWGGAFRDVYPHNLDEAMNLDVKCFVTLDDAKRIFIAGLAAQGNQESMREYNKQMHDKSFSVKRKFESFFEVKEIIKASNVVKAMYKDPIAGGFPQVGKIKAKTWHHPGAAPLDLVPEEKEYFKKHGFPVEDYEFIVEDEVLEKLFPGIKIRAMIYETSFGVMYFDSITSVLCSFYTFLNNEDLVDWKPHRFLPQRETMEAEEEQVEATIIGKGIEQEEPRPTVMSMYGGKEAMGYGPDEDDPNNSGWDWSCSAGVP